jgi:tetratricopeptide (TPR) repeat protein
LLSSDADIPFKLAYCYAQQSSFLEAEKYYDQAIELDPHNSSKINDAANNCYEAGHYKKAIQLFNLAEENGYIQTSIFYENWAINYLALKNYGKALEYYLVVPQKLSIHSRSRVSYLER